MTSQFDPCQDLASVPARRSRRQRFSFAQPLLAVAALSAGLLSAPGAIAADLTVNVTHARSLDGVVQVALYSGAEGWLKDKAAIRTVSVQPDAERRGVAVFKDVPAGTYAVSSFHDENGNGKLDANLVGVPKEPYGFSRDAKGFMGPPKFSDASFQVTEGSPMAVDLKLQ